MKTLTIVRTLFEPGIRGLIVGCTGAAYIGKWARWNEIVKHVNTNGVETGWRLMMLIWSSRLNAKNSSCAMER
jgi:hypothetical protein